MKIEEGESYLEAAALLQRASNRLSSAVETRYI